MTSQRWKYARLAGFQLERPVLVRHRSRRRVQTLPQVRRQPMPQRADPIFTRYHHPRNSIAELAPDVAIADVCPIIGVVNG